MQRIRNYINGEFREAASGETIENVEPATGAVYSTLPDSGAGDVEAAVEAAAGAFDMWSGMSAEQRCGHLMGIADTIDERRDALARAESIDNGKPLKLARELDIPRAAANFRFFATAILHTHSEAHAMSDPAINYTIRRPLGVAACISPWNLPLYLFTWKIAPALATGNTVVGKPSEATPMTAHLLAEILDDIGFPRGALNILHGSGPGAGAPLVEHPGVGAVSFTGGTATGAAIARAAAPQFKKLSLELGGKNPNIVFADADPDLALETSIRAAFANQGQICLCGSRIFIERAIFDEFRDRFIERARGLRIGDPLEEGADQGAIVSDAHLEKIRGYVELARAEGGVVHCGGASPPAPNDRCKDGYFFEPTVITGLDPSGRVQQEEIFGPVVTLTPFDDEDHALAMANGVPYGLSATVFTSNLARAHRMAGRLEAGVIWINCWLLRDLRTPFGGMKQSGVGREGGDEALRFFTESTNICIRY